MYIVPILHACQVLCALIHCLNDCAGGDGLSVEDIAAIATTIGVFVSIITAIVTIIGVIVKMCKSK